MAKVRSTVSFDEQIIGLIDEQAQEWVSDRSNTIKRIVLEWQQMRQQRRVIDARAPYVTTEAAR